MRRLASAAIVALLLSASCLFPSIDALEGGGNRTSGDAGIDDSPDAKREIACADHNCQIPFQLCCASSVVNCIGPKIECDGMRIACDDDNDCAGTNERICCLVDGKTIGCQAECTTPVCTNDPTRCEGDKTCKAVASGAGHKACQ